MSISRSCAGCQAAVPCGGRPTPLHAPLYKPKLCSPQAPNHWWVRAQNQRPPHGTTICTVKAVPKAASATTLPRDELKLMHMMRASHTHELHEDAVGPQPPHRMSSAIVSSTHISTPKRGKLSGNVQGGRLLEYRNMRWPPELYRRCCKWTTKPPSSRALRDSLVRGLPQQSPCQAHDKRNEASRPTQPCA